MNQSDIDLERLLTEIQAALAQGGVTEAALGLERLRELAPQHPQLAELDRELVRRRELLGVSSGVLPQIRQLTCPGCGSALPVTAANTRSIACAACGAVHDASGAQASLLRTGAPSSHPPMTVLRVGMEAELGDSRYQIIARQRFHSSYLEWDPEDKQYTRERWTYDQWTLVSDKKEYLYLCEDAEGYSTAKKFNPTNPHIPDGNWMTLHKGARERRILEKGESVQQYFEGELPWVPDERETVRFAEYREGSATFSVEWRVDRDTGKTEEVEFYESLPLSRLELYYAFNLKAEIAAEEARLARGRHFRGLSWIFAAAAVVLAFLSVVALGTSGELLYSDSFDLAEIPEAGLLRGPFTLQSRKYAHAVNFSIRIPDNTYSWLGVELLDSDQVAVNAFEGDFWRESGYDSDGSWSESFVDSTYLFRLSNPGEYYALIHHERGTAPGGTAKIAVYQGRIPARYFGAALALALLLAGYYRMRGKVV